MADRPRDSDLNLLLFLTLMLFGDEDREIYFLARRLRDRLRETRDWSPEWEAAFDRFMYGARDPYIYEFLRNRLIERFRESAVWLPEIREILSDSRWPGSRITGTGLAEESAPPSSNA